MTTKEEAEKHSEMIRALSVSGEISEEQVRFIWDQAYEACAKGDSVQALVKFIQKLDCECCQLLGICDRCRVLEAWERATK